MSVYSFIEEAAMKSRDAKIEFFSRARQWTLATGIALMLVASPQAWAGIACLCEPQLGRKHSCCQTAHRSSATAEMEGEHTASETSTSCETAMQATGVAQAPVQSPPVTVCCVLRPQSEPPASFVPTPPQVDAAPVQSADDLLWSAASGPAHTYNPICRCSKRPLYLSFSCLLI
jgi:hypothetical protein